MKVDLFRSESGFCLDVSRSFAQLLSFAESPPLNNLRLIEKGVLFALMCLVSRASHKSLQD